MREKSSASPPTSTSSSFVPHRGSLCRFQDEHGVVFYAIQIRILRNSSLADVDDGNDQSQQHQPDRHSSQAYNDGDEYEYDTTHQTHELVFTRRDFDFCHNLFAILDVHNGGLVAKRAVAEFATLRCPVFWRRDEDASALLYNHHANHHTNHDASTTTTGSPTFDEIWQSVVSCSQTTTTTNSNNNDGGAEYYNQDQAEYLGVEGWMVFCRFVCLAQYLEGQRRFSARHLQQTMRHRNAPRGSEVVVVDVPPPTPPLAISPERLAQTERLLNQGQKPYLPLPELDLDHSLLAAHELYRNNNNNHHHQHHFNSFTNSTHHHHHNNNGGGGGATWNLRNQNQNGTVRIELFGAYCASSTSSSSASAPSLLLSSSSSAASTTAAAVGLLSSAASSSSSSSCGASGKDANNLEFALTFTRASGRPAAAVAASAAAAEPVVVVVRRSMADMKWLDDTFSSHKVLGGTLCGRILPPFPGTYSPLKNIRRHMSLWSHNRYNFATTAAASLGGGDDSSASILKTSTNGAIAAAAAGVGKIRKVAKSLLLFGSSSGYHASNSSGTSTSSTINTLTHEETTTGASGTTTTTSPSMSASAKKQAHAIKMMSAKSSMIMGTTNANAAFYHLYNPSSPVGQARQLERYLNYLLEHPALSTSFPLNTILTASQSGLDAARKALEDCTRASNQLRDQTLHLDDGKIPSSSSPYYGCHAGTGGTGGTAADLASSPNFAWVRTAAQAAMALRVHGMLETTGMQSASARLQHASLPAFAGGSYRRAGRGGWEDDDQPSQQAYRATTANATMLCDHEQSPVTLQAAGFEEGVISVASELVSEATPSTASAFVPDDDDYTWLPLPVPAPERRILNAGINCVQSSGDSSKRQERFHYGTSDYSTAVQGPFWSSADDDGSRSSAVLIGSISVDENIDKLREVIGSADYILSRCLMASGAIGAARYERQAVQLDVVRGLDTWHGMRGKFINQIKLMKGVAGIEQSKEIYEESDLVLVDDISWQTSLASAAVSAAEDVRSAVRAARTAANAKAAASAAAMAAQTACETPGAFATFDEAQAAQTRSSIAQSHAIHAAVVEHEAKAVKRRATLALAHDVKCWNVHRKRELLQTCMAFAKAQHEATRRAVDAWSSLSDGFIRSTVIPSAADRRISVPTPRPTHTNPDHGLSDSASSAEEVTAKIYGNVISASSDSQPTIVAVDHELFAPSAPREEFAPPTATAILPSAAEDGEMTKATTGLCQDLILPFATASPILEVEDEDEEGGGGYNKGEEEGSLSDSKLQQEPEEQQTQREQVRESSSLLGSGFLEQHHQTSQQHHESASYYGSNSFLGQADSTTYEGENPILSESMQSLVNGLMTWGGGLDADEDHFALPAGLAASIVMEGALGPS